MGAWRDLTPGELEQLFEAIGLSREEAEKANARRPMQLEPMGGYTPTPKIRHPKRYAEVARHREKLEHGAEHVRKQPREGSGFSRRTSPSAKSNGGGTSGKARSSQSHRTRRPGGSR
ncbi:MAG: hypothetical protein M9934_03385 [Thermomicrobiales bacterium]|nr:hypothetical protein [Thermomicrobiales bacterium]